MISRAMLKVLREDINQALASAGQKHNLTLEAGHITFDENHLTVKVEGTVVGAKSKEAEIYEREAAYHKLPPLGTVITLRGTPYAIRGMKPRGKNCIIIERQPDAKEFVTDILTVVRAAPKKSPTMTLAEFTAEANRLEQIEVAALATGPNRVFGAEFVPLPEVAFSHYHAEGYTPQQALAAMKAEAEAEMRFEARAS